MISFIAMATPRIAQQQKGYKKHDEYLQGSPLAPLFLDLQCEEVVYQLFKGFNQMILWMQLVGAIRTR
jgi:hypothetical protein